MGSQPDAAGARTSLLPVTPFGPDGSFIPGRLRPHNWTVAEIEPWSVTKLNHVSVASLVITDLFPTIPTTPVWIFPIAGKPPHASGYCKDLITTGNVKALLETCPWEILENSRTPICFDANVGGRLGQFVESYLAHEEKHLQAYWESSHSFPIEGSQDSWLLSYRKQRSNRGSHTGNSWKQVLAILIAAMQDGWCDLDILLDLTVLHFPKRGDKVTWFPGVGSRRARLADPSLDRDEPSDLLGGAGRV
ncbi:hypothetical protein V7S43_004764 [Phytophthora oleae]|uniref:Uncharacterized protein n=1 Tax=Phytophthora oleae TaxID=2107226 RepID=A0ABD3FXN4_9STRA